MNWAGLQHRIYEATKLAFKGLGEKYPSKDFYAYVLYTDSDAMSISPSANSMEDLNHKIGQELKDEEKTEENIAYYRWASAEWAHEAGGGEFFKEINRDLRESGDRSEFDTFKIKVLQAMTGALEQLVKDRFFHSVGRGKRDAVVFVTLTDDDQAEAIENSSAKSINPEAVYTAFQARYDRI